MIITWRQKCCQLSKLKLHLKLVRFFLFNDAKLLCGQNVQWIKSNQTLILLAVRSEARVWNSFIATNKGLNPIESVDVCV